MNPPRVIEVGDLVLVPGHEPSDGVLSLKKYPLITYEKALLGQATGGKFPSVTFLERKKMSTKTSFKRIALVAASALAIAGFSAIPAHAANEAADVATPVAAAFIQDGTVGTAVTNVITLTSAKTGTGATATPVAVTLTETVSPTGSTNTATLTMAATPTANNALAQTSATVVTDTVAAETTGAALGTLSFTPDVPGEYRFKLTPSGVTTANAIYISLYVAGAGATVASSGIGTATISGVSGGQVKVNYMPAEALGVMTASTVFNASSSGTGSVVAASQTYTTIPTAAAGTTYSAAVATTGTVASPGNGYTVPTNGTTADWSGGVNFSNGTSTSPHILSLTASAAAAGVQTILINSINATTGAPTLAATITITWGAVGVASTVSTAYLNAGTTYAASDPATGVSLSKTYVSTTAVANIGVTLLDNSGTALLGQKLTVAIAGPGAISVTQKQTALTGLTASVTAGIRASTDATANTGNTWMIGINADGTAGTSTITISVGSTVIATKSLSFYGAAAKLTATQNYSIAKASAAGAQLGSSVSNVLATDTNVPAVSVEVTDANGVDVAATLSCSIANITVINSCVILPDTGTLGLGTGFYNVSVVSAPNGVSGKSTVVTIRTQLADGSYVSTPVTFTLGGAVVSTSVALDKTSYAPGEAMVLTVTAKDSAGNPSFDGQAILGSISSNKSVGGALPAVSKVFALGKYATSATAPTLYAPALSGDFTISGVSVGTVAAPLGVAYSLTASVEADAANGLALDAANAATDAANNAYDEAQNATQAASDALAAVTALSAQVSALIATVKSLAAMVAKIKAKVKA